MSETLNVFQAITAVAKDVGAVGKDGVNQAQKFRFRGIDAVVNAVSPAMRRHGLVIFPVVDSVKRGSAQTAKGGTMNTVEVIAGYVFTGPDGSSFTAKVPGEAFDSGDKATAKAMSVAFRTCLLQTFALPTDDTDPDADTYEAQRQHIPRPQQNPDTYQQPRPGPPQQQAPQQAQQVSPSQWAQEHGSTLEKRLFEAKGNVDQLRTIWSWAKGTNAPEDVFTRLSTISTGAAA